jgi:cell division protein FtsQ
MARKASGTILQEELYPSGAERSRTESAREELDDARLVDLDVNEESPFLRGQKRVSARRTSLPRKTTSRLLWASIAAAILCVFGLVAAALYHYGEQSWRFRIESSDNIEITGMQNVTRAQIMEVMGADIGRNIFFVPLAQQKAQLEQVPWVEAASVMRFVPNRLKVEIHERTPVAFARVGPRIALIDAGGTLMELPRNHKYSFPVILGMNAGEPLSTRAPRMKAYNQLVHDLDAGGAHYSQDLSEVDLTDLDDLKVRVNDAAGDVLVELGSSDFLKRYRIYVSHVQAWRQQFQKLESVNLRYDNQVIVNPDLEGRPKQALLSGTAARAAEAAGVKPAALVTRVGPHDRAVPKPAFEMSPKKLETKSPAGRKPVAKPRTRKLSRTGKQSAAKRSVTKARDPAPKSGAGSGKPAPSAKASATIPKPSPGIAKQQANTSPN